MKQILKPMYFFCKSYSSSDNQTEGNKHIRAVTRCIYFL